MSETLLNTRGGHKGFVTKLLNSATSLMENFNEHNPFKLMSTKHLLVRNFRLEKLSMNKFVAL